MALHQACLELSGIGGIVQMPLELFVPNHVVMPASNTLGDFTETDGCPLKSAFPCLFNSGFLIVWQIITERE
jgi:hypothetical protein